MDEATVWDVLTGRQVLLPLLHHTSVRCVAWSADGNYIVTGGEDGVARVWEPTSGRVLLSLDGPTAALSSLALAPDGRSVAIGSEDGTVNLWDIQAGKRGVSLEGHTDIVRSIVFSADASRIFTASSDGTVRIWDSSTGREMLMFSGLNQLSAVALSSDQRRLAIAGAPTTILEAASPEQCVQWGKEEQAAAGRLASRRPSQQDSR